MKIVLTGSLGHIGRPLAERLTKAGHLLSVISNTAAREQEIEGLGAAAPPQGLPTVQAIAGELNLSPNYLSILLKTLTGKSTQHHVQDRLIERAKKELSTTDLTVSEVAYSLGFEYSQSFSRLFKKKTSLSPLEFRRSFN